MAMLLTILRLTAFLLSAVGYVAVARAYWKITARASYIFVFSAQALIIYFAGLAGVLSYAAYTLFGGGIVLLVTLILNKKIKQATTRRRSARSILHSSPCLARSPRR